MERDCQGSPSGPDPVRVANLDDLVRELGLLRSRAAHGTRSAKVSVEDLAGRVGEPRSTIHAYLTGKRLAPAQVLDRIVIALGASSAEQHEWAEAWYRVTAYRDAVHRGTGGASTTRSAAVRQLPAPVDNFTGREDELAELTGLLGAGRPAPIAVVSGMPGVGKTALAVHWAHAWSSHYPDGQLYVDLRGFDPEAPAQPGPVLAGFLRALGVPGSEVPRDLAERAALYRSLLAGRRVLVVLDNARNVEQLRSLLPGAPGCAVLVTSRDSLAGLIARHGGHRVELDVLPADDAVGLLRALLGSQVEVESGAAAALAEHCSRLPLALRIVAELAGRRPGTSLAELSDEFAVADSALDLLDVGDDDRTSLRTVFSWSYARLAGEASQAFRLLAVHPGTDLRAGALAALTGTATTVEAQQALDVLARANLVRQSAAGRYQIHPLLRAYAGELAAAADSLPYQRAAMTRLLDHYLQTAAAAMDLLFPGRRHRLAGVALGERLVDAAAARNWLDAERENLVALTVTAGRQGWRQHAIALADTVAPYFDSGGQPAEAVGLPGSYRQLRDPGRLLRSVDGGAAVPRPAAAVLYSASQQ